MGFFKSIGKKLKRVVSLKNLTRAVTGQFSAIGKDVIRVATTNSPAENRAIEAAAIAKAQAENVPYVPAPAPAPVVLPKMLETMLDGQGQEFNSQLTTKLAQNPQVQNLTDTLVSTGLKAYWVKYRNWIIGFLVALLLFFVGRWAFFSGKSRKGGRK